MSEQKTIREWLEELPDGYRELALKNYDPNCDGGWLPENDLADAIVVSFHWEDTPEKRGFWMAVWWWALGNGELPQLPEDK